MTLFCYFRSFTKLQKEDKIEPLFDLFSFFTLSMFVFLVYRFQLRIYLFLDCNHLLNNSVYTFHNQTWSGNECLIWFSAILSQVKCNNCIPLKRYTKITSKHLISRKKGRNIIANNAWGKIALEMIFPSILLFFFSLIITFFSLSLQAINFSSLKHCKYSKMHI